MRQLCLCFIALGLGSSPLLAASFAVSGTSSATAFITNLLGPGITVVGTPTYVGAANQSGTFSGGTSSLVPFDSGVVLTTGDATRASVPYTISDPGTALGTSGDSRLTTLAGAPTYDAAVLTFSFTSTQNQLLINYAFASSEYPIFVGNVYNDVFAFYLNGTNLALVPGTSLPVSVNNVNSTKNSAYYGGTTGFGYPDFEYGGITKTLTASGTLLSGVNTISIAIADTSDDILDSAVFIQGVTTNSSSPEPATFALFGAGLAAVACVRLRRRQR